MVVSAASGLKRLRSNAVSKLRSMLVVVGVIASMTFGGAAAYAAVPARGSASQTVGLSHTDVSSSPQRATTGEDEVTTTSAEPTSRRSANGTTRRVTIGLLAVAAATAVMASIFFWYTIPSRRVRIHERDR